MIRIAVLLSGRQGRGSNMESIARACASGEINGRIVLVLGNFSSSAALARAQALGLAADTLRSPGREATPADDEAYAAALLDRLEQAQPDLVCLAGYIRKVPLPVVRRYAGRMINIHNALLPAFGGQGMYGGNVHQAAIEYGVKVSGCTVHFVDEHYDTGPIISQSVVPVLDNDTAETLAARVLVAEHQAFPQAVALFAQGRLQIEARRVRVLGRDAHCL